MPNKRSTNRRQWPSTWLTRRERFRLVSLVVLLVLVLVAIRWASRPSSWYWLTGPGDGASRLVEPQPSTRSEPPAPDSSQATLKLARRPGEERPDRRGSKSGRPDSASKPEPSKAARGAERLNEPAETRDLASLLALVRDDTLGVRHAEQPAYEALLARLRHAAPSRRKGDAVERPDYTVLMLEPHRFRGRLVRLDGQLRRLLSFRSNAESVAGGRLWEAWVFVDGDADQPCRVVCLAPPEGVPESLDVRPPVPVRVTGLFFKRFAYPTAGGQLASAPLVLTDRLTVVRRRSMYDEGRVAWWLGGLLIGVGVLAVWAVWVTRRSERRFRQAVLRRLVELAELPSDSAAVWPDDGTTQPPEPEEGPSGQAEQ